MRKITNILKISCLMLIIVVANNQTIYANPNTLINNLPNFQEVVLGSEHSCGLTNDGVVLCWGGNEYGQLGNGNTISQSTPIEIVNFGSIATTLTAGWSHTCAAISEGGVKCWGNNYYGQLGTGNTIDSSSPINVIGITDEVSALAAGNGHTCILTAGGGVKCWGSNQQGQLGNSTTTSSFSPVDVDGLAMGATAIASGSGHNCAITMEGGLKCWGSNWVGQLGDGTEENQLSPVDVVGLDTGISGVAADGLSTCALTSSGEVKCWGANAYGPTPMDIPNLESGVKAISMANNQACALMNDNSVKCWDNFLVFPQDVVGLDPNVIALGIGPQSSHNCVVMADGKIQCWGSNNEGQLAQDSLINSAVPIHSPEFSTLVEKFSMGGNHGCALTDDGSIKCWGANDFGQLGNQGHTDSASPVEVVGLDNDVLEMESGGDHTCVLTESGGVKCWGLLAYADMAFFIYDEAVAIEGLESNVQSISLGAARSCALMDDGMVKCWYSINQPFEETSPSIPFTAIATGTHHTCGLTNTKEVMCWGDNDYGQLGDGTFDDQTEPVSVNGLNGDIKAIFADSYQSCAINVDGGLQCWGNNIYGQLGNDTTSNANIPVQVNDLSTGVENVSIGENHTCAVTSLGEVKCWGRNNHGQLGRGTFTDALSPILAEGMEGNIEFVSCGDDFTCAVTSNRVMKCWGSNNKLQLGVERITHSYTPLAIQVKTPTISSNYSSQISGGFITITGSGFPANETINLYANGTALNLISEPLIYGISTESGSLTSTESGDFVVFLDLNSADSGYYKIEAMFQTNIVADTNLFLEGTSLPRDKEGDGVTFSLPIGIALEIYNLYLPEIINK